VSEAWTNRTISLAPLTILELSPADMVNCAAKAGFRHLGLRLAAVLPQFRLSHPIVGEPQVLRELLKRLDDTGVGIFDIEFIRLAPETRVADFVPMLEAGARLGAKHVLAGGNDPEEQRLIQNFGELCRLAARLDINVNLEPIPLIDVGTLAQAARVLAAADQPNSGIVIDPIHFDRAMESLDTIASLPRKWLRYMQFCDAPAERPDRDGMQYQARYERMVPGEGGLDLLGLLGAMPRDLPMAIEVPMTGLARTLGAVERAKRLLAATRGLLRSLEEESRAPK
jgi:sugar phosphate isomerase/epimerase